jgi:hypothetical protein
MEEFKKTLKEAIDHLKPPFLALPEEGYTREMLAYRNGAHDAYSIVLNLLAEIEKQEKQHAE